MMKIVIAGANGHLGKMLVNHLSRHHNVTALSRRQYNSNCPVILWDGVNPGDWYQAINACDIVINLAGRSVNCRYNRKNRHEILESRVRSTQAIGSAIKSACHPPKQWLQMSTATIYAHRFEVANDEFNGKIETGVDEPGYSGNPSWHFSIEVAKSWEQSAMNFELNSTRRVLLRTAMVMSPESGGVFDVLSGLVRRRLGGKQGNGQQFVSWIHKQDFLNSIDFIIENDRCSGPVNLCSPNAIPNGEFMKELRNAWGVRMGLPATRWMLSLGAFVMRTEPELILKSRRVFPKKLVDLGFEFQFPDWKDAARDLCRRWIEQHRSGATQ